MSPIPARQLKRIIFVYWLTGLLAYGMRAWCGTGTKSKHSFKGALQAFCFLKYMPFPTVHVHI